MTWTCCGTAPCRRCSAGSGRRRRWGRSCARSPGGTCCSWTKVNRVLLAELARRAPLLPGSDTLAFVDIDSQQKRVYGHSKQGAAFGHTKIQGKSRAGPRPERAGGDDQHAAGRAGDRRDPAARRQRGLRPRRRVVRAGRRSAPPGEAGCTGMLVIRIGLGLSTPPRSPAHDPRSPGRCFSVTVQHEPQASRRRSRPSARTPGHPSRYPRAIWDEDQLAGWVSDAEVAEVRIHRVRVEEEARPSPPG